MSSRAQAYLDSVKPGLGAKFGALFAAHGFAAVEEFDVAEQPARSALFAALDAAFGTDPDAATLRTKLAQRMPTVPTDGVRLCVLEDILRNITSPEFRAKAAARLANSVALSDVERTSLQQVADGKPTTADACFQFVVPTTKDAGCSLAELRTAARPADVAKATVFVSHAWKALFEDAVSAMRSVRQTSLDNGEEEPFFWFDIATVNQHRTAEVSPKWWCVWGALAHLRSGARLPPHPRTRLIGCEHLRRRWLAPAGTRPSRPRSRSLAAPS